MSIEPFTTLWPRGFFPGLQKWLDERPEVSLFSGLAGSSDAYFIADLFESLKKPLLVIVETSKRAEVLAEECRAFVGEESVSLLPSRDAVPYNMKSPFGPTIEARFRVLSQLLNKESRIYLTTESALAQKVPPAKNLFNQTIRLTLGSELPMDRLSAWLVENGFRKELQVSDLGTFSIRGGIFDIYPFMTENPIRLEFWGDTIESIREFDVFSQKSKEHRTQAEIFPMKEFCFAEEQITEGIRRMLAYAQEKKVDIGVVQRLEHQWKTVGDHEGMEWFLHWFPVEWTSVIDYLPHDTVVIGDDVMPLSRRLDDNLKNYGRHLERVPEAVLPVVSQPEQLLIDEESIEQELSCFPRILINAAEAPDDAVAFPCSFNEQPALPSQVNFLTEDLNRHHRGGLECMILSPNLGSAERLFELVADQCPFVKMAIGFLSKGFIDGANKRLVYTEHQLFNRQFRPSVQRKVKGGTPISGFDALSPGDFVVHVDHGIAKFVGIQRVQTTGVPRDCMVLLYQEHAKLYVPIEDFHKVQKYVAQESFVPTLSKLGSEAWERLKTRTRESLREMAQELIDLYAKRQYLEGITFSPDNLWQKEFEDAFIYEETADQLTAIKDVKQDMESPKPMDRLICGDVGFGKTEVAMRAAFKAVMDGYQAAFLAPTTILAVQHYATLTERMANVPIKIGVLSRFLKPREQKEVIEKVKNKEIDILVGTHRMLSKDVEFKNLGLLIVDEEQKFGVKHKERLKQLKYKIDVLSMTATPIPRTLHMSLLGARDLSIINTPPRNRLPVETRVSEYHDEIVKTAVENELDRGGQVYFVHNRVKNLDLIKDRIEQLVPRARIISAHGQMHEDELEIIMKEFIAGRYDVLVSTVIIENGLDIANVNTIVVNRADAMGLSQLYQLRGRVGRSSEQAFAYLLTPEFGRIEEKALLRLRALEQYTELGSGFQVAMRDLEIRGAGNILGTRQHGFITAVGFEMYCRLLQEAVGQAKGEKPVMPEQAIKIDVPLEAYIPPEYISDGAARITIYQDLSAIHDRNGINEISRELADRFGPLPPPVNSMLLLMHIKICARLVGCVQVGIAGGVLALGFAGEEEQVKNTIGPIIGSGKRLFEVAYDTTVLLKTRLASRDLLLQARESLQILEDIGAQPSPNS
jgi:transcription-repair coupling factor (superfamily II helicase)